MKTSPNPDRVAIRFPERLKSEIVAGVFKSGFFRTSLFPTSRTQGFEIGVSGFRDFDADSRLEIICLTLDS
jgi:hypothetical protein